jgi:DNA-dependent RNA polymerase auxiliary subunit epsilon
MIIEILNKCGIHGISLSSLQNTMISREILLNEKLYIELKDEIPNLKNILNSSTHTSLHQNAINTQKWPLLNLARQLLKTQNYNLEPIRVCDGYTADKKKKYKRFFKVVLDNN